MIDGIDSLGAWGRTQDIGGNLGRGMETVEVEKEDDG